MTGSLRSAVPGQQCLAGAARAAERAVLRFAAEYQLAGRYNQRVQQLGCSAARYLQYEGEPGAEALSLAAATGGRTT